MRVKQTIAAALSVAVLFVCRAYAADVILNEYNAVDDDTCLESPTPGACGSDVFWGERLGNGNDWFELVVISDGLNMVGWELVVVNDAGSANEESFLLKLTNATVWQNLRSGTLITISEDLRSNAEAYNPVVGNWWINARTSSESTATYVTVSCITPACPPNEANWKVSNKRWQLTIRDHLGQVVFGPVGEGVNPLSGVGSDEVLKLEEDPTPTIDPLTSNYRDGGSSTFGAPNRWDGGAMVQDFSSLRSVVLPHTPLTTVRVNEVFSHSDDPTVDWVELINTTGKEINIGGWYLSDQFANLTGRYQIPAGTAIPAGGYLVFDQCLMPPTCSANELLFGFSSSRGDEVILAEANATGVLTGAKDYLEFGPVETGISFGRVPDATGEMFRLSVPTRGAGNAPPLIGPAVINEIMYHPPVPTTTALTDPEFIELFNVGDAVVDLFTDFGAQGVHPWLLTGGLDFAFSTGTSIPPHGYLVVVNFDPVFEPSKLADFLNIYGIDASVAIVGPYSGRLSNVSDSIRLRKPDTPELTFVPQVLVDDVTYFDFGEWPTAADGFGPSLERINANAVGQDPANWAANVNGRGTPGAANFVTVIPTISGLGMAVLTALILAGGAILVRRRLSTPS